jgi:PAS domain S-box-containing protein
MRIADILARKGHDVIALASGATLTEAARVLETNNIGVVVVTTPDLAPVGILSERDIVRALGALGPALGSTPVERLMTRALIVCGPDDDVVRAAELMDRHHVRHLPVARDGRLVGVLSMRDVSEVRLRSLIRANDTLRKGETSYRLLLSLSPDATLVIKNGRIVYANRAAVVKFGASPGKTLIGVRADSLLHPEGRSEFHARCAAAVGFAEQTAPTEARYLGAGGAYFYGEQIVVPIVWEDEPCLLVSVRDISERKRGEAELREARDAADLANRTKSTFLANMSHELRTPLNAIIGFAEILAQELYGPLPNDAYREFTADILSSGRHLLDVINDILDLSKVEAGKMELSEELFELTETIESSVRFLRHRASARGVGLTFSKGERLPRLRADPRKVKQVLINLLANAVKFTPSGGQVTVSAEADAGHGIRIRVVDTGVGMTAEGIKTALEPFGQIRRTEDGVTEGTGLGLPLSKSLMELHGGTLDIESAAGKGTTVTLRFPRQRLAA